MQKNHHENSTERAPAGRERLRSAGRILSTWTGAAAATAILAILGGWLHHIGVRDAREVPIFRASTEPVKIRPADPGGEVTPYQNIGSYNIGTAEQAETQLAPSPPEPATEDAAMAVLKPLPRSRPETEASAARPAAESLRAEAVDVVAAPTETDAAEIPDEIVSAPSAAIENSHALAPSVVPRPENLRVRMLAARANEQAGDRE